MNWRDWLRGPPAPPPPSSPRPGIPIQAKALDQARTAYAEGRLSLTTIDAAVSGELGAFSKPQRAALQEIAAHAQLGASQGAEEMAYGLAILLAVQIVNSIESQSGVAANGAPPPSNDEE